MTKPTIYLTFRAVPLPFHSHRIEYYWTDDVAGDWPHSEAPHDWTQCTLSVSRRVLRDTGWKGEYGPFHIGQVIQVGPYALRCVQDERTTWGQVFFIAETRTAIFEEIKYRLRRGFDTFMLRTVLTLYVWGLADFPRRRPYWIHIKGARYFMKESTDEIPR